jgi:hypothetical protein
MLRRSCGNYEMISLQPARALSSPRPTLPCPALHSTCEPLPSDGRGAASGAARLDVERSILLLPLSRQEPVRGPVGNETSLFINAKRCADHRPGRAHPVPIRRACSVVHPISPSLRGRGRASLCLVIPSLRGRGHARPEAKGRGGDGFAPPVCAGLGRGGELPPSVPSSGGRSSRVQSIWSRPGET